MITRVSFNQYKEHCREEEERFLSVLEDVMPAGEEESQVEDITDSQVEENEAVTESTLSFCSSDREDGEGDIHNSSSEFVLNPSGQEAYSTFKKESKYVRTQLQKQAILAQSTAYVSNVLTALVPRLMVPAEWEEKLEASDDYGIPTLDGYLCNLKTKLIRKRKRTDMFTKTFNKNQPRRNMEFYPTLYSFL